MITFYIKEAFRLFKKSGYNSFLLIFVTTLAIIATITSIFIVYGVSQLDKQLKSGIKINVFLEESIVKEKALEIRENVSYLSGVSKVEFISKDEAKRIFLKETGEDFEKVLTDNPLPNSLKISLNSHNISEKDISVMSQKLKMMEGVEDVIYDNEVTLKIFRLLNIVQYFFYPLALLLVLLAVYLVYSNNKLLIKQNKALINTMRLVGSKNISIRIPIILNGFIFGFISSFISVVIVASVFGLLTAILNNIRFAQYYFLIVSIIFVIGLSLGFIGSYLSSREIIIFSKASTIKEF